MKFLVHLRNLPRLLDELRVIAIALRDKRTGWSPRVIGVLLLLYLLSPIDLVPDVIPFLGLLDDLVIMPLGLGIIRRLLPTDTLSEARERVAAQPTGASVTRIVTGLLIGFVILVWVVMVLIVVTLTSRDSAKENTEVTPVSSESGAKEIRTPGLIIANDALYQLSYRPFMTRF